MENMKVKAPWKDHMGDLPFHLEYFQGTLFEAVKKTVSEYPDNIALTFMGKNISYRKMLQEIQRCARSFKMCGVRKGDRVTIAMPNCPQAIYAFYALSCIGAIANMVHPLSAEKELEFYLKNSGSRVAITLDQFYGKFAAVLEHTEVENLILARIVDELPFPLRGPYMLTEGRKIPQVPKDAPVIWRNEFLNLGGIFLPAMDHDGVSTCLRKSKCTVQSIFHTLFENETLNTRTDHKLLSTLCLLTSSYFR